MTDESAADSGEVGPGLGSDELTPETLVDAVCASFSARNRERVSRDEVARVVAGLKLDGERTVRKSPALRVRRLRFSGEKRLRDQPPEPFTYDQTFAPGVNVICIPDNEVGKSSVLKTIKYALTGDNGDYDADVRAWITDVWLAFALDKQEFTILLSNRDGKPRALLVPGEEYGSIETVSEETTLAIFDASGAETIKEELQRFFFQRLGLGPLSWTQLDSSVPGGVAERSTSWLTYFQALQIPDGGDRYLLCDPQHAIGNQEGLIFSAFLGLNLVEPLNQLGVEAAQARKEAKVEERRTEEQIQQAKVRIGQLEDELEGVRRRLGQIDATQAARRAAVEGGEPARRLLDVQSILVEKTSEKAHLETRRDEMNQTLQRRRARERQLREMIALRLHFTGLEVSLCPNCDAPVDGAAIEREQASHLCRLCGKPAHGASPSEAVALNAELEAVTREIGDAVRDRDGATARLGTLRRELDGLAAEADDLKAAARQGISFALPTPEEDSERNALHEQIGRLDAELATERRKAEPPPAEEGDLELRVRVVEKVREVLRGEAARRNHRLLERLSAFTQETTRKIGAESVSDVTCSPLGQVQLRKHGERVSFAGIQNEGERLRIKLAFFLAMMRLGREAGLGRHPGFMLIDQPGSGEMVREDIEALAEVFHLIDDELSGDVQIICCTARREFEAATDRNKVYGPQNPPYAF